MKVDEKEDLLTLSGRLCSCIRTTRAVGLHGLPIAAARTTRDPSAAPGPILPSVSAPSATSHHKSRFAQSVSGHRNGHSYSLEMMGTMSHGWPASGP